MHSTAILFPAFGMFLLTFTCLGTLGIARYRAIKKGEVRASFFRTYDKGTQPDRLHLLSRHVHNHFEVPPLFYTAVLLGFMTGSGGSIAVLFAWLFLAARIVHTGIHLGSNNVSHRFFTFGFSLICLLGLWISIFIGLV